MARTKQASHEVTYLSVTVPGYKGYSSYEDARKSDCALSEEILSNLSDTVATAQRMVREGGGSLDSAAARDLGEIEEKCETVAKFISDLAISPQAISDLQGNGQMGELTSLDYLILEKAGYINQTLSAMELEEGAGISPDGPESVRELVDDLNDLLKERAGLISA
ncbi:MAG: hypothetical protein PVF95_08425 [bacterium]|jgi:hypothetical protein